MRWFLASFFGVAAALVAGCSNFAEDMTYYREGVGPRLQWDGLPSESVLLETYVAHICQQADLGRTAVVGPDGVASCYPVGREWAVFTQAGMNDIDRRCDAFLSWVDYIRRSKEHWIKQMGDTLTATAAIVGATHVGPKPMQIINAAFNLGTSTFDNMTARLLTLADTTTVQSVVLGEQKKFRLDLNSKMASVDNRPTAMYVLRSYLRICMPMSIETQINSTVTIYQQAGPVGLEQRAEEPHREVVIPAGPVTAREVIGQRDRPIQDTLRDYEKIILNYDPQSHSKPTVRRALRALCVPEGELDIISAKTTALIQVYQQVLKNNTSGKLTRSQLAALQNAAACVPSEGALNFYEATQMPAGLASTVPLLNLGLPPNRQLTGPAPIPLSEIRIRISEVRQRLRDKKLLQNEFLDGQFTADLSAELFKLRFTVPPPTPAPAPASTAPNANQ